jgi:hypothetical protein
VTCRLVAIAVRYRATGSPRSTGWWLTLRWREHAPEYRVRHARSVTPDGPYPTRASARRRAAALRVLYPRRSVP